MEIKEIENEEIIENNNKLDLKEEKRKISINTVFYIFAIGALIGWFYELIFYKVTEGVLRNNGFFYGPYLPVYGFGAVFMSILLEKVKNKPVVFFISAMILTGVVEYITGWGLEKIWNIHLWDYNGLFLNISGYVCLRSVISFAIGGLMLIYLVEPTLEKFENKISKKMSNIICISLFILIMIDVIISLIYRHPIM